MNHAVMYLREVSKAGDLGIRLIQAGFDPSQPIGFVQAYNGNADDFHFTQPPEGGSQILVWKPKEKPT
jgi:hypothetical protein